MTWQPIETAPKMKTILLFAVTDTDDAGKVRNWRMGTGFWHSGYEEDGSPWRWEGQQVRAWEAQPTHWQPLPEPPKE